MTDAKAFELGVNIATTPGKVVFQNELMQLIQYEPSTKKAWKRPLLIIPPWINKYYILGPAREELVHEVGGERGHDDVRGLVGQSRTRSSRTRASTTT
jgi:polyhydroxyalkanoate synthase